MSSVGQGRLHGILIVDSFPLSCIFRCWFSSLQISQICIMDIWGILIISSLHSSPISNPRIIRFSRVKGNDGSIEPIYFI